MSLEELKKLTEAHLLNELNLFERVLKLTEEEAKTFHEWYLKHPYVKGIRDVLETLKRRRHK